MISLVASLISTVPQAGQALVTLSISATDDDPYVSTVGVSINWGDGLVISNVRQAKPFVTAIEHLYGSGTFVVAVTARNYKSTPQTAIFRETVVVPYPGTSVGEVAPVPVIFGPILPRQQGFPTDQQWNFNLSKDSQMVESSLRMLLLTEKGERVMEPNYGTSLRRLIFSPNTADLNTEIRQEIATSVAQWEPRAQLQAINVSQSGREATVDMLFSTVIDQNTLALTISLSNA